MSWHKYVEEEMRNILDKYTLQDETQLTAEQIKYEVDSFIRKIDWCVHLASYDAINDDRASIVIYQETIKHLKLLYKENTGEELLTKKFIVWPGEYD